MSVYTIAMAFMSYKVMAKSLQAYQDTRNQALDNKLVILNQHYPLDYEVNQRVLKELAKQHNAILIDAGKNLGLHDGFNWVVKQLGLSDSDVVIGYDPDSLPLQYGWDMAVVRAIQGDQLQRVVWSSLMNPRSKKDILERGHDIRKADGFIDLWITKQAVANSICAFKYGWLKEVGFLNETCAFYGNLETTMWGAMNHRKHDWAFLPGWTESDVLRDSHDRDYVIYKWCHAHLKSWPGDFKTWLEAGKPYPDEKPQAPKILP